ncbi:MAG: hypothetical protein IJZ84_04760 [Lachnospiraceae bacterium]|nr:hypothetical protein [Lachnospiraceae bacterium]
MKFKKDNGKKNIKIQTKTAIDKGVIEEYFYMVPAEVTVRELSEAIHSVEEEAKEIWTELDLMEIVLSADSLIFENMMDTFDAPGDRAFLADKGVKAVYAVNYNTKDKESVRRVLQELHSAFGGFMASDTEDLEPIFEVAEF